MNAAFVTISAINVNTNTYILVKVLNSSVKFLCRCVDRLLVMGL